MTSEGWGKSSTDSQGVRCQDMLDSRADKAPSSYGSCLPWGREWDIAMDTEVSGTIHSGNSSKKCQGQLIICTPAKDRGLCLQGRETVFIQPDQLGGQFLPGGECWDKGGREVFMLM